MKIKKLELSGFKSFHDKTAIKFPEGISAVVGPNGCGKSNIVDALRWVMGEQSVKQLRGKDMEDVIFAGASGKPPLNMAEVSLTLSNENGGGPEEFKDFTEIMLTRRQYRSGERAYFLNRQPCRLKDIYNVFIGSGMGVKSYAIIQQGNIGAIIDAGPQERRYFIEEAAGITRYKARKTEALRKMEATDRNLLRLADITSEINRQMASLKRQARKAEMFKKYQNRIRTLDVLLSLHQHAGHSEKIQETRALLRQLQDTDIEHTTELKRVDAAIERIKLKRERKSQELREKRGHHHESQRTIDRMENDISHFRSEIERLTGEVGDMSRVHGELQAKDSKISDEIAQGESQNADFEARITRINEQVQQERNASQELIHRNERLNRELELAKTEMMDLVAHEARLKNISQTAIRNKESLDRRLKQVDEAALKASREMDALLKQQETADAELTRITHDIHVRNDEIERAKELLHGKNQQLAEAVKAFQTLDLERNKARSRFAALQKMEANFEWYRDGVQAVLKAGRLTPDSKDAANTDAFRDDVIGLTADVIEPESGYETAVEAALGESLQYILTRTRTGAVEAVRYLREHTNGRGGFIPLENLPAARPAPVALPDGAHRLLDHVQVQKGYHALATSLLGHVLVAEDLSSAMGLTGSLGPETAVVTRHGDVITADGWFVGGSEEKLAGILAKKKELKSLDAVIRSLEAQMASARDAQHRIEGEVRSADRDLQERIELRNGCIQDEIDAEKTRYRIGEDLKHATRHVEVTRLEQEQLRGESDDIDQEMSNTDREIARVAASIEAANAKVTDTSRTLTALAEEMEAYNRKLIDLKLELSTTNVGLENSRATQRRLVDFQNDGRERLRQLDADIARKAEKSTDSKEKVAQYEKTLAELYKTIQEMESSLERDEEDYGSIEQELQTSDRKISDLQTRREGALQKLRLLELELSQLELKQENIAGRLVEQYHKPLLELKAELDREPEALEAAAAMSTEDMEEELARNRKRISTIADVNLGAIREYEQLKARFDFLAEQREDLEKALNDLQRVIKKINRITQERFLSTFNAVNDKIRDVFPRLFTGGTAKLILTDPSDPLETGVEFMIHPPGKKLTRMSLLSGGEKALSAIAFIFSLFLLKPTTFCIMDEIDAPLDDANVTRFNELLHIIGEKSQIVMITHNKRTMEFSDTLFGVTMEKKGISKIVSVNLDRSDAPPVDTADTGESAAA